MCSGLTVLRSDQLRKIYIVSDDSINLQMVHIWMVSWQDISMKHQPQVQDV